MRIVVVSGALNHEKMRTLGVDLASQPQKTATCIVDWRANESVVESINTDVNDERLLELAGKMDKVGIDIPFGWPEAFVGAITAHHCQQPWPATPLRNLRYRRTDLFVHEKTDKWPLSVSTDMIAIPALRAAALMCRLAEAGTPIDRTGAGKFVEVYPAAALLRWRALGTIESGQNLSSGAADAFAVAEALERGLCKMFREPGCM